MLPRIHERGAGGEVTCGDFLAPEWHIERWIGSDPASIFLRIKFGIFSYLVASYIFIGIARWMTI
jgi:hypothetical protein